MPNKKTRLEIYFDVLRAIKSGNNRKTWIMRAANISWHRLNEMLTSLISQGFVEEVKTLHWSDKRIKTSYDFTLRGEKMMSYLEQCEVLSDEVDLGELLKDKDSSVK
jgi:predicted transcriptional regulator